MYMHAKIYVHPVMDIFKVEQIQFNYIGLPTGWTFLANLSFNGHMVELVLINKYILCF